MLSRVWTAAVVAHDERRGTNNAGPIAQTCSDAHLEARRRALELLLHGSGFDTHQAVTINRLYRRVERWTDVLVGGLWPWPAAREFAVDAQRAEDFAIDLADQSQRPGGGNAWRLTLSSLRNAFQTGLCPLAANPTANARVTASILGCFPADLFDSTGVIRSPWMLRLAANASDAQGLITDLLESSPPISRSDAAALVATATGLNAQIAARLPVDFLLDRFGHVARGMVARADERAAGHLRKADATCRAAQLLEFFRRQVTHDRQVFGRRTEILPKGQEITAGIEQVSQRVEQLGACFAQPEHQAALGFDRRVELFDAAKQFERPAIDALAAPHLAIEPRHGLGVVVENFGRGGDHALDGARLADEVGREHFDRRAGRFAHRQHRAIKMFGAAVSEVVARDGGDHDMLQSQPARPLRPRARARRSQSPRSSPWGPSKSRRVACRRCPES